MHTDTSELPVLASPAICPPLGGWHSEMSEHCLSETGEASYWYPVGGFYSFHLSIQKERKRYLVKNRPCKLMIQLNFPKEAEKLFYIFKIFFQVYKK
jgi:hypothetical protein